MSNEKSEIIMYQTDDGQTKIDVKMENETVWLTQAHMAELFQTSKQNISLHINNAFNPTASIFLKQLKSVSHRGTESQRYTEKYNIVISLCAISVSPCLCVRLFWF